MNWYAVQTHTRREKAAQQAIENEVAALGGVDWLGEIMIPTERVVEMRSGKKREVERQFFPGYVLVKMEYNEEAWHLLKRAQWVIGCVASGGGKPTPLSGEEMERIHNRINQGAEDPQQEILYEVGSMVRVIDGPFKDYQGTVEEVTPERDRLHVQLVIFGRNVPVELEFSQVERA